MAEDVMTKSGRCEIVLNALFYWEPKESFQKRCDMITSRLDLFKTSCTTLLWIFCRRAIC